MWKGDGKDEGDGKDGKDEEDERNGRDEKDEVHGQGEKAGDLRAPYFVHRWEGGTLYAIR